MIKARKVPANDSIPEKVERWRRSTAVGNQPTINSSRKLMYENMQRLSDALELPARTCVEMLLLIDDAERVMSKLKQL
jgi:hypothetical protein